MTIVEKEVYFNQYCHRCKYASKKEEEEPCATCLENGSNENSHKPTHFEEARNERARRHN